MENERNFNRIRLNDFIIGNLVIIRDKEYSIPINISNISGGGIGFESKYDFPLSRENQFRFEFVLDNEEFLISGFIKLKSLTDSDLFYYGTEFVNIDEKIQSDLVRVVNHYEISQRRLNKKE
jgi:c-di-GMP-binding flagellar brake protein YcgR